MLIDTTTLRHNISRADWVVFDCRHDLADGRRGARVYREGHLPGAYFAPVETELSGVKTGANGRHPLPDAAAFAAFLNAHGVTAETQIVAYDDVGGQYAARLWWLARWLGLTRVAVLDGGLPKWIADGNPLSVEMPTPRPTGGVIARPDATMVRSAADVRAGSQRLRSAGQPFTASKALIVRGHARGDTSSPFPPPPHP